MKVTEKIEDIIRKISLQATEGSNTNKSIAKHLLVQYKKQKSLPKISTLAKGLYISNAAISKFVKTIDVESYAIIKFIFALNLEGSANVKNNNNIKVNKASELITNAKKVVMVGEGASFLLLQGFYVNLAKIGYNAIAVEAQGDQEWITQHLSNEDVIILVSFGMSKPYIQNIIKQTKAKIIVFTSSSWKSKKPEVIFNIEGDEVDVHREFTYERKLKVMEIVDTIHQNLKVKW